MKLVYLTSKIFPATTADHFFVLQMSRAFTALLGEDFLLVVGDERNAELSDVPHYSFGLKMRRLKLFFIFFRAMQLIRDRKLFTEDTVFFSNDRSLLRLLFFWKKFFGWKYSVISDWHMLSENKNEAALIKKSDGIVTTTQHLQKIIADRFHTPAEKILTAYGGVDLETFAKISETRDGLRKKLGLPVDAYLVGYAGYYTTMGMSKGLETMFEALVCIPDKTIKMAFIGGRPKETEDYVALAKEKGLFDRMIFVPKIPPETLSLYEAAMDVLVIPYPDQPHYREYGFPMKTYEYLAAKRPVIYSDLPIIAEVLSDCAIPFQPGDAKDLAEKILEIKNNPEQIKPLTEKGYKKAEACTWKKRAEKILAFTNGVEK